MPGLCPLASWHSLSKARSHPGQCVIIRHWRTHNFFSWECPLNTIQTWTHLAVKLSYESPWVNSFVPWAWEPSFLPHSWVEWESLFPRSCWKCGMMLWVLWGYSNINHSFSETRQGQSCQVFLPGKGTVPSLGLLSLLLGWVTSSLLVQLNKTTLHLRYNKDWSVGDGKSPLSFLAL